MSNARTANDAASGPSVHAPREIGITGRTVYTLCKPRGVASGFTLKRYLVSGNQAEVTCKACLKLIANPASTADRIY